MSTISTKINLTQFKHSIEKKQAKSGLVECLVIPIDLNNFVRGGKGIYLNLIGYELKEKKDNQTHLVKQSFSKDEYASMSQSEKDALPIVGNHVVWSSREPEPVRIELKDPVVFRGEEKDDLPF